MENIAGKAASHREKVYQYVKKSIISHAFLPGDMIYERSLAELLGVSRTPVREAIQCLQDDGWLTVVPRKGTMVRHLKRVDIEEILQLRTIIGTACVAIAARKVTASDIAYFESLLAQQEAAAKTRNAQAFLAVDMALHLAFVRFAGNRRMFAFTENLCDYFQCMGMHILSMSDGSFQKSVEEHKGIVSAIAKGDAEGAQKLLAGHIQSSRAVLLRYIAESESGA